jgi:uncharacterized membrane protein
MPLFSSKKFNKEFFRHKRNDIIFISIGVILLVATIFVFVSSVSFLSASVETAINNQSKQVDPVQFDIGALEKLGISQNPIASSSSSTVPLR